MLMGSYGDVDGGVMGMLMGSDGDAEEGAVGMLRRER